LARDGDWLKHQLGWTLCKAGTSVVMQEVQNEGQKQQSFVNPMIPDTVQNQMPSMNGNSVPAATWKVVWSTNVYVRAAPNRESPKVSELSPGAVVAELGREGDWVRHNQGWSLCKAGNNICLERIAVAVIRTWKVVWATNVYVRGAPNRESPKVSELSPGTKVVELQASGDWIRHSAGWTLTKAGNNVCLEIESTAMEGTASAPPRAWKVVWQTNVYVRSGPTREAPKVAELPPGSVVQELETQGDWVRHSKGWTLAKAGNSVCLALTEANSGPVAMQQDQTSVPNQSLQATKQPELPPVEQKLVFNPEVGQLELAKPSVVPRNESNESFFG
jgi:hypothetical protein